MVRGAPSCVPLRGLPVTGGRGKTLFVWVYGGGGGSVSWLESGRGGQWGVGTLITWTRRVRRTASALDVSLCDFDLSFAHKDMGPQRDRWVRPLDPFIPLMWRDPA